MAEAAWEIMITALKDDTPADVRLQRVLKALLRSYRFRCKSVRAVELKKKTTKKAQRRKDLDHARSINAEQRQVSEALLSPAQSAQSRSLRNLEIERECNGLEQDYGPKRLTAIEGSGRVAWNESASRENFTG